MRKKPPKNKPSIPSEELETCRHLNSLNPQYHIRWMIRSDMTTVLEIEKLSFDYPWREKDFDAILKERNTIGVVIQDTRLSDTNTTPLGFVIYQFYKQFIEIVDLAVHPNYRHKGVGSHLINKLKDKLSPQRRNRLVAMIGDKNLDGHLFFKNCGFRAVDIVKHHYTNPPQDAYCFKYNVIQKER